MWLLQYYIVNVPSHTYLKIKYLSAVLQTNNPQIAGSYFHDEKIGTEKTESKIPPPLISVEPFQHASS